MRDSDTRVLLIVVRGEPVIIGADEDFEEEPSAPGEPPEKLDLLGSRTLDSRAIRTTDAFRNPGRDEPESEKGCCVGERG
jgi:hypothetical protein